MLDLSGGKPEKGLPVWRLNQVMTIIQERIDGVIEREDREIPMVWSVMHMHTSAQLAKLLALKRGLDPELAGLVCAFHDIYTLLTGKRKEHGTRGASYVREIASEYNTRWGSDIGSIKRDEIELIVQAIARHSDKTKIHDEPYTELLKDIDSLDPFFHGLEPLKMNGRLDRVISSLDELGFNNLL